MSGGVEILRDQVAACCSGIDSIRRKIDAVVDEDELVLDRRNLDTSSTLKISNLMADFMWAYLNTSSQVDTIIRLTRVPERTGGSSDRVLGAPIPCAIG